jgi:hypothetical protein
VADPFGYRNHLLEDDTFSVAEFLGHIYLLQKDVRILAAFSLSLSSEVGQKASDPILFANLLTG